VYYDFKRKNITQFPYKSLAVEFTYSTVLAAPSEVAAFFTYPTDPPQSGDAIWIPSALSESTFTQTSRAVVSMTKSTNLAKKEQFTYDAYVTTSPQMFMAASAANYSAEFCAKAPFGTKCSAPGNTSSICIPSDYNKTQSTKTNCRYIVKMSLNIMNNRVTTVTEVNPMDVAAIFGTLGGYYGYVPILFGLFFAVRDRDELYPTSLSKKIACCKD